MKADIGAVIVTYQRYNELKLTIEALLSEGIGLKDIFIIDNNQGESKDQKFYTQFLGVNTIHPNENIASSGGFALGMQYVHKVGYGWALLFNDDSRPLKGALNAFYDAINTLKNKPLGLVKIANLNSNGEAIVLHWKGVRKPSYHSISNVPIESDLVTFDGCFIHKDVFDQIGYCDPSYFMGTYEFDYCLKAKDKGFKIYTLPNGLIADEKLGSQGGTPPWRQYYNTRNHLHLGIARRDLSIILAWLIREAKFTYAIFRFQDQKKRRLYLKLLAFLHALKGIRGKVII
ncbi:glycosyltransferase family 2 protein [Belliella sp. DSM 111904]|uniref:Glycosyltransferase family 2 protein n=1 Tax=Belliella filtrata TaxID=2923435 RepID=A0ABS9UWU2_9BACT|nr:glycosyltransferase family 2 protein [Belliella filtrata]MCH7408652.1 glycosyltransferase family 2 protein [Belliella filtrata]